MNPNEIIEILHRELNDILFVSNKENINSKNYSIYWYLSDSHIKKIKNTTSCQNIALKVQNILKSKNIKSDYIFLYSLPYSTNFNNKFFFNREFLNVIQTKSISLIDNFLQKTISLKSIESTERYTHALLEINVNNGKWIIDPTAGLLYTTNKENLLRGIGIYESFYAFNQINLLKKSIHYGMTTLYYTSHFFWNSIYHLSYDMNGGLATEFKKYNNVSIH